MAIGCDNTSGKSGSCAARCSTAPRRDGRAGHATLITVREDGPHLAEQNVLCSHLTQRHTRLAQIQLVLDLAQYFIIDAPFIPQPHCGSAFQA